MFHNTFINLMSNKGYNFKLNPIQHGYSLRSSWGEVQFLPLYRNNTIFIGAIEVFKGFRNKGFGTLLLDTLTNSADLEYLNITLEVESGTEELDNEFLKSWYERFGFKSREDTWNYLSLKRSYSYNNEDTA